MSNLSLVFKNIPTTRKNHHGRTLFWFLWAYCHHSASVLLYDLSSLTMPYRIGSFIGLGVVLMLVSYLYQRFKHIIVDE
jgi:Predicted membrane protein (DUF2339)